MTNLAHEMVKCAVYYGIVAECLRKTGDDTVADGYAKSVSDLLYLSIELSNEDVTKARATLESKEQRDTIDNNCSNISMLIARYKELCHQTTSDPMKRLQYWFDKKE